MKQKDNVLKDLKKVRKTLLVLGVLLLFMEIWKQCYLYFVYFSGHYDVWYFPFQLCSTPMYLCILSPLFKERNRKKISIYLQNFAMLGGIAALLVPDGFIHPGHPLLSFHGYLWHILLLVISVLSFLQLSGEMPKEKNIDLKKTFQDYLGGLQVFLLLSGIAEIINIVLHPYGDCDMFYISPYHLSSQPVFHEIDQMLGRPAGIFIYILAVSLGAMLIHGIFTIVRNYNRR